MADHFDMKRKQEKAGRFTLCGHLDEDEAGTTGTTWDAAHYLAGAVQAKATDSNLTSKCSSGPLWVTHVVNPLLPLIFLPCIPNIIIRKNFFATCPARYGPCLGRQQNDQLMYNYQ